MAAVPLTLTRIYHTLDDRMHLCTYHPPSKITKQNHTLKIDFREGQKLERVLDQYLSSSTGLLLYSQRVNNILRKPFTTGNHKNFTLPAFCFPLICFERDAFNRGSKKTKKTNRNGKTVIRLVKNG